MKLHGIKCTYPRMLRFELSSKRQFDTLKRLIDYFEQPWYKIMNPAIKVIYLITAIIKLTVV